MNIPFGNDQIELTPEGAVWIARSRLLCVADLHFEKDSFFHRLSTFLPPYGSLETMERLEKLIQTYQPAIFIAAGDSFHDRDAADRMKPELAERLNALIKATQSWYWIMGNHDPAIASHILGERRAEFQQGDIIFRHKDNASDEWQISGHYHPKTRFSVRGHFFNTPCFVQNNKSLFLPAFGEYTGGLNINSSAFQAVAPKSTRTVFPVYGNSVFQMALHSEP